MKEESNIDLAIHEASHFIIYLIACRSLNTLPNVNSVSLNSRRGHVERRSIMPTTILRAMLDSDLPQELKANSIKSAEWEIKINLAGIAGELIHMDAINPERALSTFYRNEKKDPNSDLSKAVEYNTVIGGQAKEDGPLPLVEYLKASISLIKANWNDVISIAQKLDNERGLRGDELTHLINSFNYGNT